MSGEEKKAIAYLKFYIERDVMYENSHYEQIKIILNLIEKQQKQIKELIEGQVETIEKLIQPELFKKYVSKDKIKEKIEIRKEEKENCRDSIEERYLLREIYVLESLLEEKE